MSTTGPVVAERLSAGGIELELVRRGAGRPVLLLHGWQTVDPRARFLDLLGRRAEILAPSHPGFGHSPRPADFETVYDLCRRHPRGERPDRQQAPVVPQGDGHEEGRTAMTKRHEGPMLSERAECGGRATGRPEPGARPVIQGHAHPR